MLLKGIHFSHTNYKHFTRETNGSDISKANNQILLTANPTVALRHEGNSIVSIVFHRADYTTDHRTQPRAQKTGTKEMRKSEATRFFL